MDPMQEQLAKLAATVEKLSTEIHSLKQQIRLGSKPCYTNEEALAIFGVTSPTLRKWRNEGLLGYSQIGSTIEYSQEDIQSFLKSTHFEKPTQKGRFLVFYMVMMSCRKAPPEFRFASSTLRNFVPSGAAHEAAAGHALSEPSDNYPATCINGFSTTIIML